MFLYRVKHDQACFAQADDVARLAQLLAQALSQCFMAIGKQALAQVKQIHAGAGHGQVGCCSPLLWGVRSGLLGW